MFKGAYMTAEPQQAWTLIQISDTHLMDQAALEFLRMNPESNFQAVMRDIQQHYPQLDALVHTGDLAQVPSTETYQRYLNFMQSLGIQHYHIPGNHDDPATFPFYRDLNQAHIFHLGKWSVVLLNSAVEGQIDGWIDEQQLKQLDEALTQHAQQHVIVACHHHPFSMNSAWIDQHRLKNTENLTDVLARHKNVKIVLCGHVHQDSCHEWNGIQFLSTPATSIQFKPHSDDFALDDEAPGYRMLYLLENGEFKTSVRRVVSGQQKINLKITGY